MGRAGGLQARFAAADIPTDQVAAPGVEYYLSATDASPQANQTIEPTGAPALPYRFTVAVDDTAGPTVNATPVRDGSGPTCRHRVRTCAKR